MSIQTIVRKKTKKTDISPFPAYTYKHKQRFVRWFFGLFCTFPLQKYSCGRACAYLQKYPCAPPCGEQDSTEFRLIEPYYKAFQKHNRKNLLHSIPKT